MLSEFKPRKAKAGFKLTISLATLRAAADLQELVNEEASSEDDAWLELKNEMSTDNSTLIIYVNDDGIADTLRRIAASYVKKG